MKDLTENESIDKLIYSYIGIRLTSYTFFFILNTYQTFLEGRLMVNKLNKTATRFFIFFSMALFCGLRIASTAMFYKFPLDWEVGTVVFLIFACGTSAVFLTWVFILHFWLCIMYSFFVSEEVKLNKLKPINWTTSIFVIIVVIYQLVICVTSMLMDIKMGQAIGFAILLAVYCILVITFGLILLRNLQNNKKNSPYEHFKDMIFKTKILVITVSLVFILTFAEEGYYQIAVGQSLSNSIQSNFCTYVIDTSQMIVVMYVLANGKFRNYILFRQVKTTSFNSNEKSSFDSGSRVNTKKSLPSYDQSGRSLEQQTIELDNMTTTISSISLTTTPPTTTSHLKTIDIGISSGSNIEQQNSIIINSTSVYDLAEASNDYNNNENNNEDESRIINTTSKILNLTNQEEDNNV